MDTLEIQKWLKYVTTDLSRNFQLHIMWYKMKV
jgi:hypothetical protein